VIRLAVTVIRPLDPIYRTQMTNAATARISATNKSRRSQPFKAEYEFYKFVLTTGHEWRRKFRPLKFQVASGAFDLLLSSGGTGVDPVTPRSSDGYTSRRSMSL
jgi:hypothetical protein